MSICQYVSAILQVGIIKSMETQLGPGGVNTGMYYMMTESQNGEVFTLKSALNGIHRQEFPSKHQ